jgi:hypothetical protein
MHPRRVLQIALLTVVVSAAVFVAAAGATAPPVGPLPVGPTAKIVTQKGQLVAVALPHRSGGRSWRIVGALNAKVVQETTEGDVGANVVIVFKATGAGTAAVTFALTRGEAAHVYEARRFVISVS